MSKEQETFAKQSLMKEFVRAASDGVKEALIDKRQSLWAKEKDPDQDEIDRLMGVTCYKMYQNPAVNNEKTRMAFRENIGVPTKTVERFGKTVEQIRGQKTGSRTYQNRLAIEASATAAADTIDVSSSGSGSEVEIVQTKKSKKDKKNENPPPSPPSSPEFTIEPLATRVRNAIYDMAKKERDAGKRTEMRKAMSLVVKRDEQAMVVIDVERSEFGIRPLRRGFHRTPLVAFS